MWGRVVDSHRGAWVGVPLVLALSPLLTGDVNELARAHDVAKRI
jgi:hypothetical protein